MPIIERDYDQLSPREKRAGRASPRRSPEQRPPTEAKAGGPRVGGERAVGGRGGSGYDEALPELQRALEMLKRVAEKMPDLASSQEVGRPRRASSAEGREEDSDASEIAALKEELKLERLRCDTAVEELNRVRQLRRPTASSTRQDSCLRRRLLTFRSLEPPPSLSSASSSSLAKPSAQQGSEGTPEEGRGDKGEKQKTEGGTQSYSRQSSREAPATSTASANEGPPGPNEAAAEESLDRQLLRAERVRRAMSAGDENCERRWSALTREGQALTDRSKEHQKAIEKLHKRSLAALGAVQKRRLDLILDALRGLGVSVEADPGERSASSKPDDPISALLQKLQAQEEEIKEMETQLQRQQDEMARSAAKIRQADSYRALLERIGTGSSGEIEGAEVLPKSDAKTVANQALRRLLALEEEHERLEWRLLRAEERTDAQNSSSSASNSPSPVPEDSSKQAARRAGREGEDEGVGGRRRRRRDEEEGKNEEERREDEERQEKREDQPSSAPRRRRSKDSNEQRGEGAVGGGGSEKEKKEKQTAKRANKGEEEVEEGGELSQRSRNSSKTSQNPGEQKDKQTEQQRREQQKQQQKQHKQQNSQDEAKKAAQKQPSKAFLELQKRLAMPRNERRAFEREQRLKQRRRSRSESQNPQETQLPSGLAAASAAATDPDSNEKHGKFERDFGRDSNEKIGKFLGDLGPDSNGKIGEFHRDSGPDPDADGQHRKVNRDDSGRGGERSDDRDDNNNNDHHGSLNHSNGKTGQEAQNDPRPPTDVAFSGGWVPLPQQGPGRQLPPGGTADRRTELTEAEAEEAELRRLADLRELTDLQDQIAQLWERSTAPHQNLDKNLRNPEKEGGIVGADGWKIGRLGRPGALQSKRPPQVPDSHRELTPCQARGEDVENEKTEARRIPNQPATQHPWLAGSERAEGRHDHNQQRSQSPWRPLDEQGRPLVEGQASFDRPGSGFGHSHRDDSDPPKYQGRGLRDPNPTGQEDGQRIGQPHDLFLRKDDDADQIDEDYDEYLRPVSWPKALPPRQQGHQGSQQQRQQQKQQGMPAEAQMPQQQLQQQPSFHNLLRQPPERQQQPHQQHQNQPQQQPHQQQQQQQQQQQLKHQQRHPSREPSPLERGNEGYTAKPPSVAPPDPMEEGDVLDVLRRGPDRAPVASPIQDQTPILESGFEPDNELDYWDSVLFAPARGTPSVQMAGASPLRPPLMVDRHPLSKEPKDPTPAPSPLVPSSTRARSSSPWNEVGRGGLESERASRFSAAGQACLGASPGPRRIDPSAARGYPALGPRVADGGVVQARSSPPLPSPSALRLG